MAADNWAQLVRQPYQRRDVEACLLLHLVGLRRRSGDFALTLDHDDALQFRPIMAFLQPRHIMEHGVDSGFYAAMIAVDRLTLADLCILEAVGLLLGGRPEFSILVRT